MLFPKSSLPKMPPSDWKKSLQFGKTIEKKETTKPTLEHKQRKPIAKVSEKKKKRLKEQGSEKDVFLKVWNKKPHVCEICGKALKEPKPHNFDHKIPKSRGEKHRLDESNIQILCFACHFEKTSGLKYK
jgi:5-methylcytosine-specific restriction endonuclease McrA